MARWTDGLANRNAQASYENNLAQYGSDYMGKANYGGLIGETVGNFSAGLDRLGSDMLGAVSYGLSNIDGDTAEWARNKVENEAKWMANLSASKSTIGDTANLSWGEQVVNPHYWSAQLGNFAGNVGPQIAIAYATGGTVSGAVNAARIAGLSSGVARGLSVS